jgi:hypothetical protein
MMSAGKPAHRRSPSATDWSMQCSPLRLRTASSAGIRVW